MSLDLALPLIGLALCIGLIGGARSERWLCSIELDYLRRRCNEDLRELREESDRRWRALEELSARAHAAVDEGEP